MIFEMILKVIATSIVLCGNWCCNAQVGEVVIISRSETKGGSPIFTTDCLANGQQIFVVEGSFTYSDAVDNIAKDGATLLTIVDNPLVMEGVNSLLEAARGEGAEYWTDTTTEAPEAHYALYLERDGRLERTLLSDDTELEGFIAYRACENS